MKFKTSKGTVNLRNSFKNKIAAGTLAGVLVLSTTGCGNYKLIDTKYNFNKAITIKDGIATIYDIEKWTDYDGEQIQLILKNGTIVLTSSFDTKLFNTIDSEQSIEMIARSYVGEEGQVIYFGEPEKVKNK